MRALLRDARGSSLFISILSETRYAETREECYYFAGCGGLGIAADTMGGFDDVLHGGTLFVRMGRDRESVSGDVGCWG